jgi:hypothetical protein
MNASRAALERWFIMSVSPARSTLKATSVAKLLGRIVLDGVPNDRAAAYARSCAISS